MLRAYSSKYPLLVILMAMAFMMAAPGHTMTLMEAYDAAGPSGEYDRWIELETGVVYTGGLLIGPILMPYSGDLQGEAGEDVRIVGNGAIIDLQGAQLCISYCDGKRLDISDCIIVNGNIRFRGWETSYIEYKPRGSVRYVTFFGCHDYGIRLQGTGEGILLERNLLVDAVDTGMDWIYSTGFPGDRLPTGPNICPSIQIGMHGFPDMVENWTWMSDPTENADPLSHFCFL